MNHSPSPPNRLGSSDHRAELRRYDRLTASSSVSFDRLVRLATRLFNVPIALVNFVDEHRQWCKASRGLDLEDTAREFSFCAHAAASRKTLVVEDAREDIRFAENPFVTGPPGIRFYAGAPLMTPNGYALGAVCLIDTARPRTFSTADVATLEDLAALAMREIKLQDRTERWHRLVETHLEPIVVTVDTAIQYINPSGAAMLGAKMPGDLIGHSLLDFYRGDDRRRVKRQLTVAQDAATEPQPTAQRVESEIRGLGGERRIVVTRATGISYKGERGVQIIAYNVTEQRRRERQLVVARREAERARDQAEEMSRFKSSFLANMSHEIRTPLTAIIGFAEVLRDDLDGKPCEYIELIYTSSQRLYETLTSVLDLAQLESGSTTLRHELVDLAEELEDVVERFERRAQRKGIDLRLRRPAEAVMAYIDPGAVERILLSLLSNAIKFTGEGYVEVRLTSSDSRCVITVKDTGVGIHETAKQKIFDEFKQESEGLGRSYEGSGLGLTITKRLIEMMDGTITVDSVKGEGSTFVITLPRHMQNRCPARHGTQAAQLGLR